MPTSTHSTLDAHVKKALLLFIEAFFKELKERRIFHPQQQHIIVAQISHGGKKLNVPLLVHVRWLGGRQFGFLAHTIVGERNVKELVEKILEEERKLSTEIVPRERGKLSILWGTAGLRAVQEAIAARAKTTSPEPDYHLVKPESRSLMAALYVLQKKEGVDAPLYLCSANKRDKLFWFYVPDEKIHTYDGEKDTLHFGRCSLPYIELTHTRKPIVVARKAVLDV